MDNIAEGFDRGGNRELIQFLSISKGSTAETQSQLYRMLDRNYLSADEFKELLEEAKTIGKMLGSSISYLKQSGMKGSKFHEPYMTYATRKPETRNPKP